MNRSAGRAYPVTGAAGCSALAAPPPGHADWPMLAATATRIHRDRETGDARLIAANRLTADQAAHRLATARALDMQWQAVLAHDALPLDGLAYFEALGAWPMAVQIEIAEIARAGADRARADPTDANLQLAGACAALAWYQQSHGAAGQAALILRVHAANQQARAERAARPAPQPIPLPVRTPRPIAPASQPRQMAALL